MEIIAPIDLKQLAVRSKNVYLRIAEKDLVKLQDLADRYNKDNPGANTKPRHIIYGIIRDHLDKCHGDDGLKTSP